MGYGDGVRDAALPPVTREVAYERPARYDGSVSSDGRYHEDLKRKDYRY